ncbi:MAG: DUF1634 domain-containing protein [Acidobacteriota bacterium]
MAPSSDQHRPTDQDVDLSVAAMLRFGIVLSALVVATGGVLLLLHPNAPVPNYAHFRPGDSSLRTLKGVFAGAIHLRARSIIQLGLLLLIATPVARVVFCVVGFARQRDRLYVGISLFVLAVLVYSLTRGAH